MLRELHISGLGVIEDLDLEFDPGLNVLTGETGAGKTMVTVGLMLALGARASAHLVRPGASAARIQARFDAPPGAEDWAEDGEVILARTILPEGKGGVRIGGQLATVSAMQELGARLVEFHGQHQTLRLLDPAAQTAFLDRFAGDAHLVALATYREAFDRLAVARRALDGLTEAARDRERELDLLAYQVNEIQAVAPAAGETEALQAEEARLSHVERLMELSSEAESAVASEGGAADLLGSVRRGLQGAAELDPGAGDLASRAAALAAELAELSHDLRGYRESLATDPERAEEVRERLAALKGLHRKYGPTDADVLSFLAQASERLHQLSGSDQQIARLSDEVAELQQQVSERSDRVGAGRAKAAPRLAKAITNELQDLGMPGASVRVELQPTEGPGAAGAERAQVVFSAGAGQPPAPFAKVASGGELSRVMLACRSVLADIDDVPVLVFDEVDAGIGGEAGLAVGRRLARLASDRQVLVVTHLPQIACFADRQIRVKKTGGRASVQVVADKERAQELSRMLAGMEDSEHALSHAQELLVEASSIRSEAR